MAFRANGSRENTASFWVREISNGVLTGLVVITIGLSMAALIFHGELSRFFGYGVVCALSSTLMLSLVLCLGASYKGTVAGPQSASCIVLAAGVGALYGESAAAGRPDKFLIYLTLFIVLTSVARE